MRETIRIAVNADTYEEISRFEKKLKQIFPNAAVTSEGIRQNKRVDIFGVYYAFFHIHTHEGGSNR
ncbi:unnamed protein product [marine sediment metagenome]|uniref:Uncharacterized protein n=1 Tax=marine sediment metagenome TaxID=412755 RepID=X1RIP5_9ZZZZ